MVRLTRSTSNAALNNCPNNTLGASASTGGGDTIERPALKSVASKMQTTFAGIAGSKMWPSKVLMHS
eukprot:6852310-Lingulodinium_polyedra.AAC.1